MKTYQKLLWICPTALVLVFSSSACNKEAKAAQYLNAAKKHDQKADYAAAEIEYKNALKTQPGNPEALKGLGLLVLRQGAMLESAEILSAAKLKYPEDDEIGLGLGKAFLALGFVADARKELLGVISRQPRNGEALLLLAEASFTPEALNECEQKIAAADSGDQSSILLGSALIAMRRGQPDVATGLVERAIRNDPRSARAHAFLGNLNRRNKQEPLALEHLKTASELGGNRSDETGFYAIYLAELGRRDEANKVLERAVKEAPDYLPNWRHMARFALASGDQETAAAHLGKILSKSPLDIEAGTLQSQLWMLRKENQKAVELLEKLNETFPLRPNLELSLAKAQLAAGDSRKAAQLLDRVLAAVPGALDAIQLRAALYLRDGQPADAIRLIEPVHAASLANRAVQQLLIAAYQSANRINDAIAMVRKQAETSPDDPEVLLQLGTLLLSQGQGSEARDLFERSLARNPEQLAAIVQLVMLDQSEGKQDAAMNRIDAYLKQHPDSPQAHLVKAGLCYAGKDFKGAEAAATKTIELKPDDTTAYSMLVRIQISDGRAEEAVTRLRELVKTKPENLSARMFLGSLLREIGRIDEARKEFEDIVKIDPNFAAAWNDLAYLDIAIPGRLDNAWESSAKAHALRPEDPAIADTYGWIAFLRGDCRQAMPILQDSARRLPAVPSVHYHLAMVHSTMYQIPEAIAALEKALSISGGFPERQQAEAQLAILKDGKELQLAELDPLLESSPQNVVLWMLKADKLIGNGRFDDAVKALEKGLQINPDLEAAYLRLVDLHLNHLNQSEKALELARQARKVAPESPRVAAALGKITLRIGQYQEAYELLGLAAREFPTEVEVQTDYARAAYAMGEVELARSIMAKHLASLTAGAEDTWDFLVLTDPKALKHPDAAALATVKLETHPDDVPALMLRAALQERSGEDPVPTYLKVRELMPQFIPASIALARVYLEDPAKIEAAEELANAARERSKDDPELTSVLALVNFRKGQFDYAAQLLGELSTQRGLTGAELFALGMSKASTHQKEEASKALTQAIQAGLTDRDAAEARSTLEELAKPDVK